MTLLRRFFSRTDWVLLGLCLAASVYGIIVISSATNLSGAGDYVRNQVIALVMGLTVYVLISFMDMEILAEHTAIIVVVCTLFLATLYPFGVAGDTGNRSWLQIPGLPFMVQPAEYCKIFYIVVVARICTIYQERINSIPCILRLGLVSGLFIGLIVVISRDAGVALIYVFTFIIMALAGDFSILWFIAAGVGAVIVTPIIWTSPLIEEYQKQRIQVVFDSSIDPLGTGVRYQATRSLSAISGGGLAGQGLYHGIQTQADAIPAQHTDFVFAVIGEELGFLGCFLCIALLVAIVLRIIYVGTHSQSYFYRQICVGIAGMLLFQILTNVGMCLGLMPVIGLTLPFFSYGGSSILSLYIAMGVIGSVRMHPSPDSQQRYIQLPI